MDVRIALKRNAPRSLWSITGLIILLTPLANIVADHPWRKPKPGVLLQAVSDLGLDPARCAILGDKISDIDAGAAARIGLRVTHRAALCQNGWTIL